MTDTLATELWSRPERDAAVGQEAINRLLGEAQCAAIEPCQVPTLRLFVPQPVPQVECMAISTQHLDLGETASFRVSWPTSGIPRGAYFVHGLFRFALPAGAGTRLRQNIPPVMVTVG